MDEEELDARETQWLSCNVCYVWVHSCCGNAQPEKKCFLCKKGKYVAREEGSITSDQEMQQEPEGNALKIA